MPALQDPHEVILSRILQLDASEFEELTRALLEALGFEETEVTGKTGDGGVGVIGELHVANLARVKLFVQAKRYGAAKVSDKPIRDLRKVIPQGCQGAVITTSGFDSKAREAAEETGFANISLIDGHQLVDLLVEHWNAAGSGTEGESQSPVNRHPPAAQAGPLPMSTAAFCAVLLSFHPPALWANFRPRGQGLALAVPPAPGGPCCPLSPWSPR